jgi:hypothetical protein
MAKDDVLLEISYNKLLRSTDSKMPGRSDRASDVTLTNTVFIPYVNDNYLEVESEARTKNGKYITRIVFENVVFKDEGDNGMSKIISPDGTEYYFKPINKNRSDVKVSCTCLDFYYRFAAFNQRDNALASDPPKPYVKKTDRAPVNPSEISGVCKHLIRMVDELEKDNVFSAGWFQKIKRKIFR